MGSNTSKSLIGVSMNGMSVNQMRSSKYCLWLDLTKGCAILVIYILFINFILCAFYWLFVIGLQFYSILKFLSLKTVNLFQA